MLLHVMTLINRNSRVYYYRREHKYRHYACCLIHFNVSIYMYLNKILLKLRVYCQYVEEILQHCNSWFQRYWVTRINYSNYKWPSILIFWECNKLNITKCQMNAEKTKYMIVHITLQHSDDLVILLLQYIYVNFVFRVKTSLSISLILSWIIWGNGVLNSMEK